jgi:hypothetical protein
MSIEEILTRIAVALEGGAGVRANAAVPAAAPAKTATKPAKAAAAAPAPAEATAEATAATPKEMGEAIVALIQANKRTDAVALLAKYGAKAISEVKPADVQAVHDNAKAILELA